jgi:hypothetical protein
VVSAFADISTELRQLPNSVIETFIDAKAPLDPRDAIPLEQVNLNPRFRAVMLSLDYGTVFDWFGASTRSLRLERDFPYVGPLNEEEIDKIRWEKLNEEVKKAGGVDRLVFSILPVEIPLSMSEAPQGITPPEKISAEKLSARLAELLESPAYSSFVGADGQTHSFTPEEKELIKARGKLFFETFEKEFLKLACQSLSRATRDLGVKATGAVGDDDIVAQMEKQVLALGKAIIMAKDTSKVRRGKVMTSIVEVHDYKYDLETRMAAAQMLNDGIGSYRSWSRDVRGQIGTELRGEVDGSLNAGALNGFNESKLTRQLRDWYLEQQQVLSMLPPAPM